MGRRYDTISFLSDLGLTDEHVGVAKAIVRDLAPHAGVVDLPHATPPYHGRAGRTERNRAQTGVPSYGITTAQKPLDSSAARSLVTSARSVHRRSPTTATGEGSFRSGTARD